MKEYTLAELTALPTLLVGYTDNLKIDHRPYPTPGVHKRVWLSRLTAEDGAPYDNEVTIEGYYGDEWLTLDSYEAK